MNVSQRDKRLLMILGGVAAVAAVLFVLLLRGGGSNTPAAAPPAGVHLGTNEAKPAAQKPANPPKTLVFSGRDPFQILVSLPTVTDTSGSCRYTFSRVVSSFSS